MPIFEATTVLEEWYVLIGSSLDTHSVLGGGAVDRENTP